MQPLTVEDVVDVQRVVFETAPDAILVVESDGTVALANAAARDLSYRDAILDAFQRDPEWMAFRVELRTRGRASMEARIDEKHIAIVGRNCAARAVLFVRDVTAAREAEQDLARLWGLASIGAFAAAFVHDFGNLVTPLSALGDALAREVGDGMGRAFVQELRRTTSSARELVHGVRAFLRGRPSPPQQVPVNELVDGMRPLIERVVGADVSVVFALDTDAAEVAVDRVRFERGLLNLVANARDAMPGGGRVVIRTFSALFDGNAYVALSVTDEGTGMSPEARERAFEPFFTSKEQSGSGLGLWVVRRFVRDAGGRLEIRSELGEGTQVTVYLPRTARRDADGGPTTDPYRLRDDADPGRLAQGV